MENNIKEMLTGCCVCGDEQASSENLLVYCDGPDCNIGVHQACYGIASIPKGDWYCRKCKSGDFPVRCVLCPSNGGALKRTDDGKWAHVVCALYIPEVEFRNAFKMEPIVLSKVPRDRFSKACYICAADNRSLCATVGACMQCNKRGCKKRFHVTCAQISGLLCEEAGKYAGSVIYCGYCDDHDTKVKKDTVTSVQSYESIYSHENDSNAKLGRSVKKQKSERKIKHVKRKNRKKKCRFKESVFVQNSDVDEDLVKNLRDPSIDVIGNNGSIHVSASTNCFDIGLEESVADINDTDNVTELNSVETILFSGSTESSGKRIEKETHDLGKFSAVTATGHDLGKLLEKQWEQTSEFLMKQAEHHNVAAPLNELNEINAAIVKAEEKQKELLANLLHYSSIISKLSALKRTSDPIDKNVDYPHRSFSPESEQSISRLQEVLRVWDKNKSF